MIIVHQKRIEHTLAEELHFVLNERVCKACSSSLGAEDKEAEAETLMSRRSACNTWPAP